MARVRIILEDNNGQPLTAGAEQLYPSEGPCNTRDTIATAVRSGK